MTRAAVVACAVAGALAACGPRRVPPPPAGAALYRDLERIVAFAETTGWHIDRLELEVLLSQSLESVCRVPPATRDRTLAWIDAEIARLGGPVEQAYLARGRDLDRVDDLLALTRVRKLLGHSIAAAAADCPFWVEPSDRFAGRQISDDRFTISLGGGGKGIFVRQGGQSEFRGGGAGRLLVGRTFGSRAGLYTGVEIGGNGSFPRDEEGRRGELVIGADVVVPLVYRHTLVSSYFEAEAGWLGTATEGAEEFDPGIHLGAAFGGRATRTRWFFPGVVFGVGWERTFPGEGPALYLFKVGLRGAIDIDL
ncbi:MAG TPA: hypothetical protein VMZ28_25320 [Kofleriaceae bacterium]|nr:hypothetical protein [Kofleriaceae bacterium]